MALKDAPKRALEKLPEGWTAADVVAAGREGLMEIDGIGPASADALLAAAQDELAATEPDPAPESGVTTPDLQEASKPDDEEPAAPAPPAPLPAWVEVKLIGVETAIVGMRYLYRGETRRVRYAAYERAAANHPGALLVRRLGEKEYRKEL